MKQYFPQIGEDKTVTAQKRANRETAIQGIMDAGYMPGQTRPSQSTGKIDGTYNPKTGKIE
jgi:hypothetical protein